MRYKPKFFNYSEFDSKDAPGTGVNMQDSTLIMLDEARRIYGKPIVVRDGFRTRERQLSLIKQYGSTHAALRSAHELGYASDLEAVGLQEARNLIKSLYEAGFRRFGIMETAIHVDNDPARPSPSVWNYPTTSKRRFLSLSEYIKSLQKEPLQVVESSQVQQEEPATTHFQSVNELMQTVETICSTLAQHCAKNGIKFTYCIENA
jgi:hypothetical protein